MTDETTEGKRLSPGDWAEAAELYELGEANVTQIAKKYGVSVSAVSQRFKRMGVVGGSRKHEVTAAVEKAVKEDAASSAVSFSQERRKKIEETKQQSYQSMTMIHALTHSAIVEAKRDGAALSTILGNLKALRQAAAIIAQTRQERYVLLEAQADIDQSALPVLQFEDLTAIEVAELQIASEEIGAELIDEDIIDLDEDDDG